MTSKTLRSKYKGVKWIYTRYAKPYLLRMALKRVQAAMMLAQSLSAISMIRSSRSLDAESKARKALAIAKTVVSAHEAVNSIEWKDKARSGSIDCMSLFLI